MLIKRVGQVDLQGKLTALSGGGMKAWKKFGYCRLLEGVTKGKQRDLGFTEWK
jgi:hypothetical protein